MSLVLFVSVLGVGDVLLVHATAVALGFLQADDVPRGFLFLSVSRRTR